MPDPTDEPFRKLAKPANSVVNPMEPTIGQVALCGK
jgi:hypothetical protein